MHPAVIKVIEICGSGLLAITLIALRFTVFSMLRAGKDTNSVWRNFHRQSLSTKLRLAFKGVITHFLPGKELPEPWKGLPIHENESELLSVARPLRTGDPTFGESLVGAIKASAWGWICSISAIGAFICKLVLVMNALLS